MNNKVYKYGIDITNATLQTYAYELGLEKAVAEMTQAEKMQLRMIAILDQSKVSWGDLANTINSPANMIRQFKNNLKEAGMVLGQLFIPVLEKVFPYLNGLSIAIKNLLIDIAGFLGVEINIDSFGTGYNQLEEDVLGVEDSLEGATESAKEFKSQLQGFDKLNVLSSTSSVGSMDSLSDTIDLTEEILKATQEYESAWMQAYEKMENKAQEWAKTIEKSFGNVKKLFKDISIGDWSAVGTDVSDLASSIFDTFSRAIKKVDWEDVGKNIANFLNGIEWAKVFRSVGNFVKSLWDAALTVFAENFLASPFETTLLTCLALVNFTPLGMFLASSLAKSWAVAMGTKPISDTVAAGLSASLGSEAAKSALVFQASSLGTIFANAFTTALGGIAMWFEYESENAEWGLRDRVEYYKSQGYDQDTARNMAAADMGDGYFNKVGLYNYDVETAEHKVQLEQAEMLRGFFKKLGKGFSDLWENIKGNPLWYMGYATGGVDIPEDGWFRASHGEYFGKFDNGTSVIANNGQIISGISNGVRQANTEQNALLREQNQLLRQILAKDTGISSRDVFNAVRSENKAYINRNGISALA